MPIVTKPNTFVANELIDANQMNQDFDSIYSLVNGNLDGTNLASLALNDSTKFANEVVTQSKTKGVIYTQDLFTRSFFVSGGVPTFPGSPINQISVTTAFAYVVQADGSYRRIVLVGTTYTTSAISTTYYLDLQPDGTISWGLAHSGQTGYLSIATVTTNGSGNVNVLTDVRVLFAGISATSIANGNVSNVEFQFLDGVTSAIQTQLDTISASDALKVNITNTLTALNALANGAVGDIFNATMAASCNQFDILYLSSTGYNKAEGNVSTTVPCVAMALATGSGTQNVLKKGYVKNSAWTWTAGQVLYVSPTVAGGITSTLPSTSGQQVQIIGYAESATVIYFNPDYTFVQV